MYLTQMLHRNAQQRPHDTATICAGRTRTHVEVLDRVSRAAGGLRSLGVAAEDRVAVLALNSDFYAEALSAIAWADAVFVPVNTRWSVSEIAYSFREAHVGVLLVDAGHLDLAVRLRAEVASITTVVLLDVPDAVVSPVEVATHWDRLAVESPPVSDAHRSGDAIAGIFYTGGTTGDPKGVMVTHRNLFTSALGVSSIPMLPEERPIIHVAPMFHLADLALWIGHSLRGGAHVMLPGFDPALTLEAIEAHRIGGGVLIPVMIQMLVDHPKARSHDLSSLEYVVYGGSPISDAVLERAASVLAGTRFVQVYGMTELATIATVLPAEDHADPRLRRSAGRAAPHALVKVVDIDDRELPPGTVGEVCVRGDHVMRGYLAKEEATADALRGGWMHTGDGGYLDDEGYLFIVDRIKDMIVTGGENVYSVEVENAVARHPAVANCAVIGLEDEQWGERVHAVVTLVPGAALDLAALRAHCRELLAAYKAPRSLEVVEDFPTSAAGKILKRELRRQHESVTS